MFIKVRNWFARRSRRTTFGMFVTLIVVAGAVWTMRISERAERLAIELRSTGSSAESALVSADPDSISEISSSLNEIMRFAQELDDDLWPLRWAGNVVGRVPVVGDNVNAVPDLVERVNDDLAAADALIGAADFLVTAYVDISNREAGLIDTLSALPTESEIADAIRLIDEAETALIRAAATADHMEDGRLLGRLERGSDELDVQEARLREVTRWTGLSAESLLAMARLGEISLPLVGLLGSKDQSGPALNRDALSAMPELEAAASNAYLAVVATNAESPTGIAGSPIVDLLLDFEPLLNGLAEISSAGGLTWTAVSPALKEMETSEGGLIGEDTAILTALKLLGDRRPEFQEARLILEAVATDLRTVMFRSQIAASTARTVSEASEELAKAVDFLSDFPAIGPRALGADGIRRYLVLGQTSDELRGSGGFISGAWILTVDRGHLSDLAYHDVVGIDDRTRLELYPSPPELLAQHMDAPVWLLRDATWSPEFPAAAQTAAEIFELGQGGPKVDGVIALTEWAIVELVGALGTINTHRGEIDADELLPALESGTDAEGREFVDTLFRSVLDEFRSPRVNDRLFAIASAASEMLTRKDTMVFMFDTELQEIVARSGWDGSLGRPDGDKIAVIDSNVGWNKVDRNIQRSFKYHVALHPSEPMEARLDLTYRNLSEPVSRGCDVQAPVHGLSYAELKEACYWNLIRVYVPDGGTVESNGPLPVPAMSVYARSAVGLPGDDSVNIGVDSGGKFISGLMTVPPGETATVGFDVIVPATAVVSDGDQITYRLFLTAQSGALGRDALIDLEIPVGYDYVGSSHEPTTLGEKEIAFAFRLESDTEFEVMMRRSVVPASSRLDAASRGPQDASLR